MATLSPDDRTIIAEHPLDNSLDHLLGSLRKAEKSCDAADDGSDQRPKEATLKLLAALLLSEAANYLPLKTGNRNVASDLLKLRERIQKGDFTYQHYRLLSQLVIQKASDHDIWNAVFNLITALSRLTPPTSIPPSYDGTPVTRSSASFQGKEQTRKLLKNALFWEINSCTYRSVKGFFEKYFGGKGWSRRSKEIYNAVKKRHVDGRWTDFPDPPIEDDVWDWLSRFQNEVLTDSRNAFYRAEKTSDLTGGEPSRQMDIFFKHRSKSADAKHDWKDVLVVGEHKKSDDHFKDDLLQLSGFVREVFAVQPTRHFVHGFILFGTKMELWVFDRSGPYSSGEFDIHREPEKFILALAGYAMMSDDELGLDTFLQQEDDGPFVSVIEDVSGKEKRLRLEPKPFVKQRAIVCRGTTCFRTHDQTNVVKFSWTSDKRKPEVEHLRLARKKGVKGISNLLGYYRIASIEELRKGLTFPKPYPFRLASPSLSFLSSQSPPGVSRSLKAFGNFSIDEVVLEKRKSDEDATTKPRKKSRSKLSQEYEAHQSNDAAAAKPPSQSRSNSQRSKLSQEHKALQIIGEEQVSLYASEDRPFENRLFCCLVISPAGRALIEFESILELLTVLRDAIKAHRSLYCDAGILHRDISESNIIIADPKQADGFVGMLIDLDLAKVLNSERSGARYQTGTMEFMAIQVLQRAAHTYRHDLESFFYVLLWICARRSWEMGFGCKREHRPADSALRGWYAGTFKEISKSKGYDMGVVGFRELLEEFPDSFGCIKPLCTKIRGILFPILKDGSMDIGTPSDPPERLYDAIIRAYDDAIADIAKVEGR